MKTFNYCCPVLELVVKREARQGIRWATSINLSNGKTQPQLILDFPRAKDRKEEYAGTTYAPINFCPFCGERFVGETKAKKRAKKAVAP